MKVKKVTSASRTLILDGYNVIHAIPELERRLEVSLQASREALLRFCEAYRASRGDIRKIVIVFDGKSEYDGLPSGSRPGVEIIFTSGETADERILELIQDSKNTDSFIVVSNDNYVSNNSRAMRTSVVRVSEFRAAVSGTGKPRGAGPGPKAGLPDHAARKITDEYRRHLGI